MTERQSRQPAPEASTTEAALQALDADGLRALIREMIPWLDDALQARFANTLIDQAARTVSGWIPQGPTDAVVAQIERFAAGARRAGGADPAEVDALLVEGSNAFLARHYEAACRIFRALLVPIANVDIDLGQDELVDEVLGVDPTTYAAQYVASIYMTAGTHDRAKAVASAIDEVRSIAGFPEPLRELERVAIEPLPDFESFLAQWKALLEQRRREARQDYRDSVQDHWLREAVRRTAGPEGLAEIARTSKRADDLRAWCRALVEGGDWQGALAACDEAAGLVADKAYARGGFLDDAALAAQVLARRDLPARLERAWREAPTVERLSRWLGSSSNRRVLLQRVCLALTTVPREAHRQRGLLHVLSGHFEESAKLLAAAEGLGWSSDDHPGHLLFPLFVSLLGGTEVPSDLGWDDDVSLLRDDDEPRLATPQLVDLLRVAGIQAPTDPSARTFMINAMRIAARKRIAGVTDNGRRRHYGHAASLALACARVDTSAAGAAWLAGIRHEFRRYPALRRELG